MLPTERSVAERRQFEADSRNGPEASVTRFGAMDGPRRFIARAQIILEKGYDATSVSDIALNGLTKPAARGQRGLQAV